MSKIKIDNLSLAFSEKKVLKNISFSMEANTVTALIGPSGCGKSTLLRAMNRLHDLQDDVRISGSIFLDGKNIYDPSSDVHTIRSRIGMVFQKPNPFAKSVHDNITYGLKINGVRGKKTLSQKVEQSLKDSFLWEEVQLQQPALALSGGQQQRLCIARCIAIGPEVILMDEPTSALDPLATQKIEDLILRLKNEYTIVIVTHNMQQAKRIADKVAMLYLGELIEYAPKEEFFNAPKHELAQKYVSGEFG